MALSWEMELPQELPSSVAVYQLAPPRASQENAVAQARRLGLRGDAQDFQIAGDWISYQEGTQQVSLHGRSGALYYRNREKYGVAREDREFEIPDENAEGIARQFAADADLVPDDEDARLEKVSHLRSAGRSMEGEEQQETTIDAGVLFRRVVEDIPVAGPGGELMVNVDPDAEVVGTQRVWRGKERRLREVSVRPREHALWAIETLAENIRGDVTVRQAALAYFEFGPLDRQSHLEPAFVFVYDVTDGEVGFRAAELVPAGEQIFGALKGQKRFPGERRPRPH